MISIIKNGKEKSYYARCQKCGTEMEYMHADVRYETSAAYNQTQKLITCPVCGETIMVNLMTKDEVEAANNNARYSYSACCCG